MSSIDFHFGITFLVTLVSLNAASCLCSIYCPCGNDPSAIYTQCLNKSLHEKYTCERWSNCKTCQANTDYCITCPTGRSGPTCTENKPIDHIPYCTDPGQIPYGSYRDSVGNTSGSQRYAVGDTVTYYCQNGYDLVGTEMITCPPSGSWPMKPICRSSTSTSKTRVALDPSGSCSDPGSIPNGYRRLLNGVPSRLSPLHTSGQSYQYFCNEGYVLEGTSVVVCLTSGQWSSNIPRCQRLPIDPIPHCTDPGQIPYGSYRDSVGNTGGSQRYAVGDTVTYYCQNGYDLVGTEMITCTTSGSWPMKPICRSSTSTSKTRVDPTRNCPDPGTIENGYRRLVNGNPSKLSPIYNIGQSFEYFCNEGYEMQGANILTCVSPGRWTNSKAWCQGSKIAQPPPVDRKTCPIPPVDPHGEMAENFPIDPRQRRGGFDSGSQVTFTCKSGYELYGTDSIICLSNGQWTDKPPICQKISSIGTTKPGISSSVTCPIPQVDPNSQMEENFSIDPRQRREGFEAGNQVSFTCKSGYELEGPNSIICLKTGRWTADPPTCQKISSTGSCGQSKLFPENRITHEKVVQEGEFPWIVLISINESTSAPQTFTGILIDHTTVITVAHYFENVQSCTLYFGKLNRSNLNDDRSVETRLSSQIIIHPNYDSTTHANDIAIVKFPLDIPYSTSVQPICAPTPDSSKRNIVPGQTGYLVGWGLHKDNVPSPNIMTVPLSMKSRKTCSRDFQNRNQPLKITSAMFCAGFSDSQERSGVCYEGSGSALVFYNRDSNRFTLEGIASHRPPGECTAPENHIVFTRVSNYVQWILQYLKN